MFVTSLPVPQVVGTIISSLSLIIGSSLLNSFFVLLTSFNAKSLPTSKIDPPPIAITLLKSIFFISLKISSIISSLGSLKLYLSFKT